MHFALYRHPAHQRGIHHDLLLGRFSLPPPHQRLKDLFFTEHTFLLEESARKASAKQVMQHCQLAPILIS